MVCLSRELKLSGSFFSTSTLGIPRTFYRLRKTLLKRKVVWGLRVEGRLSHSLV